MCVVVLPDVFHGQKPKNTYHNKKLAAKTIDVQKMDKAEV